MPCAILFNKPFGVVCQFSPAGGRATLADFICRPGFYPAGRLDADSEGLVVLTSEGALQHAIAAPGAKLKKVYCAQVEGLAAEAGLAPLRQGIRLSEFVAQPAGARLIEEPSWLWPREPPIRYRRAVLTSWVEITLTEGKNRQVRRMTAAVGLPTLRLIRYAVGPWTLGGLSPGTWIEVEAEGLGTRAAVRRRRAGTMSTRQTGRR